MNSNNFFQLVADFQKNIDWLNQVLKGDYGIINIDGVSKPTITKAIDDAYAGIAAMVQGRAAYKTKADLPASPPSGVALAQVWNDPVQDQNGLYGWDGAKWVKSQYDNIDQLEREVDILSSRLDSISFKEVEHGDKLQSGFYISKTDGNEVTYTGWLATPYIPVTPETIVKRESDTVVDDSSGAANLAFYDDKQSYLGYFNTSSNEYSLVVSSLFSGARFIRASSPSYATLSLTTSSQLEAASIEGLIELIDDIDEVVDRGKSTEEKDFFLEDGVENGFIDTLGNFVPAETWRTTAPIAVMPGDVFTRQGYTSDVISPVALYGEDGGFQGRLGSTGGGVVVDVIQIPEGTKFVRASAAETYDYSFVGAPTGAASKLKPEALAGYVTVRSIVDKAFSYVENFDYFSRGVPGYIDVSGRFVPAANWIATEYIPVSVGDVFTYQGTGSSVVLEVAAYDEQSNYLRAIYDKTNTQAPIDILIEDDDIAFIRSSARNLPEDQATFSGLLLESNDKKEPLIIDSFSPKQAYITGNESLYLYSRGIVPDHKYQLAWNFSESNEKLAVLSGSTPGTQEVKLSTLIEGKRNIITELSVVRSGAPVNPSEYRNFVCIGDSLTLGVSNTGISGAYPNELSRRLNGIGTALLSGENSPPAGTLDNIRFLGTLGDQPVKHEGRGGWTASNYLNLDNALRDPISGELDFNYWATNNGFDHNSLPGGVLPDGSNITCIILLGWNDVYRSTPSESYKNLVKMINSFKGNSPNADFIVVGLNPGPVDNQKAFSGDRYVSQMEIWNDAVFKFGNEYKKVESELERCEFLQLSHVFNTDIGYKKIERRISSRSSEKMVAASDHVHPNATGYAMIADAIYHKIVHDYCQGA
ncbi:SGNH/GDSL hydrolase family protein [Vibrio cortegadensis]|uniref:SGNH/GDSL hydrolase family protein n=1 Tax=Vibrio cortegadensis TaxID=1328770 RepID=UPI0021C2F25A|nr:SGNH/GDSL hydrolase family protein [Vibrio cortegadensis]